MYEMGSKEDKYIYHLTSLENLESIIENGLLPRAHLVQNNIVFDDNGDPNILEKRSTDEKLLFHLTPYNVFSFQFRSKNQDWVYILLRKDKLSEFKHEVIKNHPLNNEKTVYKTLDEASVHIDWNKMKHPYSKYYNLEMTDDISMLKMSEVQIEGKIEITSINKILVGNQKTSDLVYNSLSKIESQLEENLDISIVYLPNY